MNIGLVGFLCVHDYNMSSASISGNLNVCCLGMLGSRKSSLLLLTTCSIQMKVVRIHVCHFFQYIYNVSGEFCVSPLILSMRAVLSTGIVSISNLLPSPL